MNSIVATVSTGDRVEGDSSSNSESSLHESRSIFHKCFFGGTKAHQEFLLELIDSYPRCKTLFIVDYKARSLWRGMTCFLGLLAFFLVAQRAYLGFPAVEHILPLSFAVFTFGLYGYALRGVPILGTLSQFVLGFLVFYQVSHCHAAMLSLMS